MINVPDRRRTVELIEEAVDAGAPAQKACEELEISLRTYKRWTDGDGVKAIFVKIVVQLSTLLRL
ncbi:MAG: hypothetical protein KZQ71_17230 [Candidatus Thiodiazotropha sp. (ex Lucinoma aequizonata)]|nr:hypothetical protein [Candidatus Thiodiazotropha sp. (ex Lucinoma aequizonata)]MCU7910136.1 hypothetical protein [Candidatus Thiodiazotropha sp. (ex Lucinoma aequizonata)]